MKLSLICLLILFSLTGCLDTDGDIEGSVTNGSVSISAEDILAGTLPIDVLIGDVGQLPAPIDGSLCNASEILEWTGTQWDCIPTPTVAGGAATSVPVAGIGPGALPLGVSVQTSQLIGSINPNTQMDGSVCSAGQVLISNGTVFNCVTPSTIATSVPAAGITAGALGVGVSLAASQLTGCVNGEILQKVAGNWDCVAIPASSVTSVHGRGGIVVSANGDYTASEVTNVAAGNISATTVQTAINELDSEKLNVTGGTLSGALAMGTNKITGLGAPTVDTDAVTKLYVDTQIAAVPSGADNLGDHTATSNIQLGANSINNDGGAAKGLSFDTSGRGTFLSTNGSVAGLTLRNLSTVSDSGNALNFRSGSVSMGSIVNYVGASTAESYMTFSTKESGTVNEAVRIDKDGNVGIGTASPGTKLHVEGSIRALDNMTIGGAALAGETTDIAKSIHFRNPVNDKAEILAEGIGASSGNGLYLTYEHSGAVADQRAAQIFLRRDISNSGSDGAIEFKTNDGTSLNTSMVIKSSGNVGIGTSAPIAPLSVGTYVHFGESGGVAAAGSDIRMTSSGVISSGDSFFINIDGDDDSASNKFVISKDRLSSTGGTDLFVVQENGDVGIGIATPAAKLDLSDVDENKIKFGAVVIEKDTMNTAPTDYGFSLFSSTAQDMIYFKNEAGTNRQAMVFADGAGSNNIFGISTSNDSGVSYAANLVVTQEGDVGIGTSSPDSKLEILGGYVRSTNLNTGYSGFQFADDDGLQWGWVKGNTADPNLSLARYNDGTYTATDMTVQYTTGNVGIGTTSPVVELDVNVGVINASAICDENNTNCIDLSVGVGGGSGTITSVTAGSGLSGGVITTTGTISIASGGITGAMISSGAVGSSAIANNSVSVDDLDFASTNGITTPNLAIDPGAPVAGQQYFNTTTNRLMIYNGTKWVELGGNETSALLTGWPDAIRCSSGTYDYILQLILKTIGSGAVGYRISSSILVDVEFNSLGAYIGHTNMGGFDCVTSAKSISTLVSEGAAFFYGNDIGSIAQDDDNDTKIMVEKNPDEDKIRFDTAGLERMVIDELGNVGVGTTSPYKRMTITGGDLTVTTANQIGADIISSKGAANSFRMGLGNNISWNGTGWITGTDGTSNGGSGVFGKYGPGKLGFYVVPSTGGTSQTITDADMTSLYEKMMIADDGNVGIGTGSPIAPLSIGTYIHFGEGGGTAAAGSDIRMTSSGVISSGDSFFINIDGDNDSASNKFVVSKDRLSSTGGTDIFVVQENGNVGIGTTAPADALDVNGNIRITGAGNFLRIPTNNTAIKLQQSQAGEWPGDSVGWEFLVESSATRKLYFYNVTKPSGVEFLVDGSVGIGTTSPAVELDVNTGVINASAICDENNTNCIDLSVGPVASGVKSVAANPSSGNISGDIVYNTTDQTTYVYNGTIWEAVASSGNSNSVIADVNPTVNLAGASSGDIAYNSTSNELEYYNGASWVSTTTTGGLGDFLAAGTVPMTGNIELDGNYLSGDGGNEGVFVDGLGNVGIGTGSPIAPLSIGTYIHFAESGGSAAAGSDIRMTSAGVISSGDSFFINIDGDNDSASNKFVVSKDRLSNTGGTELFIVQEDGRVGIGTTDPLGELHINDSVSNASLSLTPGGTGGSLFSMYTEFADTSESLGSGNPTGNNNGWQITGVGSGARVDNLEFQFWNGAVWNPAFLIEGGGNIGIGVTAPTALLTVNGTANKPGGGSWAVFSDIRLKDESSFKEFKYGLDEVMKLRPIYYNYAEGNDLDLDPTKTHVGFVAQEVQKVIPEAVSKNSEDFLELNNDPIIWTLLNAVKDLYSSFVSKVKSLNFRMSNIERQVSSLTETNQKLVEVNKNLERELDELKRMIMENRKKLK